MWNELKLRCTQEGLEWEDIPGESNLTCARASSRAMLITSWTHILGRLLDAARAGGHDSIRHDILQLLGLTSRMDADADPERGMHTHEQCCFTRTDPLATMFRPNQT